MASQRIRPSKLPEILAQFGNTGLGGGIESLTKGVTQGLDLASTLAERKRKAELQDLQIAQIKEKIDQAKRENLPKDRLFEAKKRLDTVTEKGQDTPLTSLTFGPEDKPATLADISTTEGEFIPDETAPRQQARVFEKAAPDTDFQIDVTPSENVSSLVATGEAPVTAEELTDDLQRQVEEYKREAYPELYGKSLFKDKPTELDIQEQEAGIGKDLAQAEALRALSGVRGKQGEQKDTGIREKLYRFSEAEATKRADDLYPIVYTPEQQAEYNAFLGAERDRIFNEGVKILGLSNVVQGGVIDLDK
jgi:hypothetical protein